MRLDVGLEFFVRDKPIEMRGHARIFLLYLPVQDLLEPVLAELAIANARY
jgi:hypothetical protein